MKFARTWAWNTVKFGVGLLLAIAAVLLGAGLVGTVFWTFTNIGEGWGIALVLLYISIGGGLFKTHEEWEAKQ